MGDLRTRGDLLQFINSDMLRKQGPILKTEYYWKQRLLLMLHQKFQCLRRDFLRRRFVATPKQKELFELGTSFRRRAIFAGNRCGKTVGGCAELAYHLTGQYPDWWKGHRFKRPIKAWCASTTREKTIGGLQEMLMGKMSDLGTSFIPWARIGNVEKTPNVTGGVSRVRVRCGDIHENQESTLSFKSYEQGRKAFETERVDFILLDEEPPYDIYRECQMRLLGSDKDAGGLMLLTFTPLQGMTKVCLSFLEPHDHGNQQLEGYEDVASQTTYMMASWEDNPHLSKAELAELINDTPSHELEARRFGRPSLGAGKIFKIPEGRIMVEPFPIPDHWLRGIGLDHGWEHPTAIAVFARDPNTGVCYLTNVWKQSETPIPEVASILRTYGGSYAPIVADPSGQASRQEAAGRSTFDQYFDEGITLIAANNSVISGIEDFRQGMISGQFKVFAFEGGTGPCADFFEEYRLYRRNDKGKVVKVRDDVMDAVRYGWLDRDNWMSSDRADTKAWRKARYSDGDDWKTA